MIAELLVGGLIAALIRLFVVALVLYLVYYVCSRFTKGMVLNVIGAILALIFALYALMLFGIVG